MNHFRFLIFDFRLEDGGLCCSSEKTSAVVMLSEVKYPRTLQKKRKLQVFYRNVSPGSGLG